MSGPRYVSWFAGIGGFDLALDRAGCVNVGACEIAAFPRRVYAERFGHAPLFEDLCNVDPAAIPEADIWCGGFPCQDVSSAGQRAGFAGARSSLVFRLLELAAVRHPEWLFLENVPGILSVRGGHDFGALIARLDDLGYVGCWRVLDAQFFGVPQRRRRVFIVARRAGGEGDPREVLFDAESVRGNPDARGATGADLAHAVTTRVGERLSAEDDFIVTAPPVRLATCNGQTNGEEASECFIVNAATSCATESHARPVSVARCLDTTGGFASGQGGTVVASAITASAGHHGHSSPRGDASDNLVAIDLQNTRMSGSVSPCLDTSRPSRGGGAGVMGRSGVRRLTPREAERLQGLPDDWTLIPGASDAARYRALGNAVAVPVVEWIARRLASVIGGASAPQVTRGCLTVDCEGLWRGRKDSAPSNFVADKALIAAAVNALPALLDAADRADALAAELARLQTAMRTIQERT